MIYIGCGPYPEKKRNYEKRFNLVEMNGTFTGEVKYKTLQRWRESVPQGFAYILGANQWLTLDALDARGPAPVEGSKMNFGFLQATDENARVWERMQRMLEANDSHGTIFRLPPAFSPSEKNKANMRAFFSEIAPPGKVRRIVESRGIWTDEELAEMADELDLVIAHNPYVEPTLPEVPAGRAAYYLLSTPMGRRDFDVTDFEELADFALAHEEDCYLVFRGPDRGRNSARFRKVFAEIKGEHAEFDGDDDEDDSDEE